jgi:hypothetical protein
LENIKLKWFNKEIFTISIIFLSILLFSNSSIVKNLLSISSHAQSQSGSIPFCRYYEPITGAHLYTTDINEGNNAVSNLGYNAKGIVGYINK